MTAIDNAKTLRLICENISSFGEGINSIVKVKNASHEAIIKDLNMKHIINQSEEMSEILIKESLRCRL
jgi:hypothetical protein